MEETNQSHDGDKCSLIRRDVKQNTTIEIKAQSQSSHSEIITLFEPSTLSHITSSQTKLIEN